MLMTSPVRGNNLLQFYFISIIIALILLHYLEVVIMEYFKGIGKIKYEGKDSRNPYSFRYYNPDEIVSGKTMKEHLRFSMAYWHTFCAGGMDMFGSDTAVRPYETASDPMELAKIKMHAAFEFMGKMGIEYFCFHDKDIAPETGGLKEFSYNLDVISELALELMEKTGIKLLWGTANLFKHPRYMHGAATSCCADSFAYAAAQVKKAIDITKKLGGENYVFWGGREGYETLLNTNIGFELDNLARFLHMAADYAAKIGFKGQFLIEPKPKEPTKHQYDFDVAGVMGFLRKYGLEKVFKMNIEANHATLAGHTFNHELAIARANNMLGSIDANRGDLLLGWDTDQFPTDVYDTTLCMLEVLRQGGIAPGGLNFDAKVRRGSFTPEDLFLAHISGMDTFARGLKAAAAIIEDGEIDAFIKNRYRSYETGIGADIVNGRVGFEELAAYAQMLGEVKLESGRQEMLESILNRYVID
jgi:xylose isomerase